MSLRDAATVVLVRDANDGAPGFEVFMLLRTVKSDFNAGAYVFPGGGVDPRRPPRQARSACAVGRSTPIGQRAAGHRPPADCATGWRRSASASRSAGCCWRADAAGRTLSAFARAGRGRRASSTHRACGRLPARRRAGRDLRTRRTCSLAAGRHPLSSATGSRPRACRGATTRGSSCAGRRPARSRCTTARKPSTTAGFVRTDALARHAAGSFNLVPATRKQLQFLARHASVEAVLAAARDIGDVPPIQPQLILGADGKPERVRLPLPEGVEEIDLRGVAL